VTKQTSVYRLFDADGDLLYVGIAGNPGRRFEQHRADKPWWGEVSRIDLEHWPTRQEAAEAESQAIREESPRYNIALRPRPATVALTLTWKCAECQQPIRDGEGYLAVSLTDAFAYQKASEAWGGSGTVPVDLAGMMSADPAEWKPRHSDCWADYETDHWYAFAVERIKTHADLLARTAHLMDKQWTDSTDWAELIATVALGDATGALLYRPASGLETA
jgi:predicted GIY-YIG superfamily endonuclease